MKKKSKKIHTIDGIKIYSRNHPTLYWCHLTGLIGVDIKNSIFDIDLEGFKYFLKKKDRDIYRNNILSNQDRINSVNILCRDLRDNLLNIFK